MPNNKNRIPPNNSFFQASHSIPTKTKLGIKWINKAKRTLGKEYSPKTSMAKRLMKRMKIVARVLGSQ